MTSSLSLDLASLRETYKSRWAKPSDVIDALYSRIQSGPLEPVWISLTSRAAAMARARELERDPLATALPLYGVPFAVKDNIDVAGLPTTAACPAFAYQPAANAAVVQALVDAGAIPIGKTNLDQFVTGAGRNQDSARRMLERIRSTLYLRRIELRLGSRGGFGPGRLFARDRYSRLGPHTRRF